MNVLPDVVSAVKCIVKPFVIRCFKLMAICSFLSIQHINIDRNSNIFGHFWFSIFFVFAVLVVDVCALLIIGEIVIKRIFENYM